MLFTCGHSSDEPRNMGRGMARQKRLTAYFGRVCIDCAVNRAVAYASRLTDLQGKQLSGVDLQVAIDKAVLRAKANF